MAILIDMPMPKTCYYCKFDVCGFCMVEELQKKDSDAKPDWCPLREVVRCKDCKNASESLVPESVYCDEMDRAVYIQGFCHHGERREE